MLAMSPVPAEAQTNADLQRQIDDLKAQVQALTAALVATKSAPPSAPPVPPAALASAAQPVPAPTAAEPDKPRSRPHGLTLRGYTQMRYNAILSGDRTAPAGEARLRSVHDASLNEKGNFSLRRVRLAVQGDLSDRISLYLQSDFASAVNNQAGTERRENFLQLRDVYADIFADKGRTLRLRVGQSKVPYGWENMQSSSNRIPLDRSDAINSAVPSERDLGVVAYYTPPSVQRIWDRLAKGGQKLFGNYGAFGLGAFNGQGTNRTEQNDGLMKVAFATWPFALDGLGGSFAGQVIEIGGSAMHNRVQPELRSGVISPAAYKDERVGIHAILYPQPFGIQAEWNWGKGPEYDPLSRSIAAKKLKGGYVQTSLRLTDETLGAINPYARWQTYRGGWKAATNAPRLETDEVELGVEWQPIRALELTIAYARMKRAEADERRAGRAKGDVLRTQLQWNY
ncbi:porin [Sphingobium amiense]|uniref:Porin n=2 Tax=Sphingobium amiense TaxID=135719 RepID=A0A494VWT4_9SPHN|nr:porin [Sphingobium amiense]BBD96873.1 porin [Sphingobium amiense]